MVMPSCSLAIRSCRARSSLGGLTDRRLYDMMYNMRRVTVRDLQHNLAELLDQVQSGQELVVTKRGKAVARIVPAQPSGPLVWPDSAARMKRLAVSDTSGPPASAVIDELRRERL
jgi:prevent-host-death family protein